MQEQAGQTAIPLTIASQRHTYRHRLRALTKYTVVHTTPRTDTRPTVLQGTADSRFWGTSFSASISMSSCQQSCMPCKCPAPTTATTVLALHKLVSQQAGADFTAKA